MEKRLKTKYSKLAEEEISEMQEDINRKWWRYIIHYDEFRENSPDHLQGDYIYYEIDDVLVGWSRTGRSMTWTISSVWAILGRLGTWITRSQCGLYSQ